MADNLIGASKVFEEHIARIMERKLYEKKRMMQAEVFGGLSLKDIELRKKAGYRKASDVWSDPHEKIKKKIPLPTDKKKEKKIAEDTLDEAGLGAAAKLVHSMTPQQKQQFQTAMKGDIGAAMKFKKSILARHKEQEPEPEAKAAGKKKTTPALKRPNILKRNINTLMGREPGYVDKRTPEEKMKEKGGRVGKVVRKGAQMATNAAGRVASEIASYSNLEE